MPAGGAESGAAARGEGGGLSAARLRQEARYPQVEVTSTRSGQVRFITRPKSRTMRATRQLMLPPNIVSWYLATLE